MLCPSHFIKSWSNIVICVALIAAGVYMYVNRNKQVDQKCEADGLFNEYEWNSLYILLKEPILQNPPALRRW